MADLGSKDVARAAIQMALTAGRADETGLKERLRSAGILAGAVDIGGDFSDKLMKFVESALVAAKREGLIAQVHQEEGAVAGAVHEALNQIQSKALGLSIGGKIGLARYQDHLCVAVFTSIGMLYLNETAVAVAHRSL